MFGTIIKCLGSFSHQVEIELDTKMVMNVCSVNRLP